MRLTIEVILAGSLVLWGMRMYDVGYATAKLKTEQVYEATIADRVSRGLERARRVMVLREQSAYERGRGSCHE